MSNVVKRRWLRFSLRGLFLTVTILALWLGWNLHIVRQRQSALAELRAGKSWGVLTTERRKRYGIVRVNLPEVSSLRKLLGDKAIFRIELPDGASVEELETMRGLFPEAEVKIGVGKGYF